MNSIFLFLALISNILLIFKIKKKINIKNNFYIYKNSLQKVRFDNKPSLDNLSKNGIYFLISILLFSLPFLISFFILQFSSIIEIYKILISSIPYCLFCISNERLF